MSSEVGHGEDDAHHLEDTPESGLEALRECDAFRGPADPVEEHDHANDHVALLYDDPDEQLAAAAAFLREGLEREERCVYVADDNARSAVLDAFTEAGIDVDEALESGALSVHTPAETYHRTGTFDHEQMLSFWEETLASATDDDHAGIRAAAEMTWALEDATSPDALVEYEAALNDCYDGEDYVVCCQYNTERFPAAVLRDVVRTHPHLIEDDVIHHNVYYTPPQALVATDRAEQSDGGLASGSSPKRHSGGASESSSERYSDGASASGSSGASVNGSVGASVSGSSGTSEGSSLRPARDGELERMLETLRERTDAKAELQEHKQYLRRLNETTADGDRSFEETVERLLELGCERFDLRGGALSHRPSSDDEFRAEVAVGPDIPGQNAPLPTQPDEGCFCRSAIERGEPTAVADVAEIGWQDDPVFEEFGISSYLGVRVTAGTDPYGTLWFYDTSPREEPFSDDERTFLELMARWVSSELERQQHEADLQETVDRLQQSNDRLKQFAYAASHDLQEPLRMISSYLQLLEREYHAELDEDATDYIGFAVDGADRMRSMVDDLLAYSRIEQCDETFTHVDCDVILDRVTDDLQVQIEECDATVVADPLPTVVADAEQLHQLFRNLVSNAVKYGGDGPTTVDVTAEDCGDHWSFAVTDDGIGIDPEQADRIFEVFQRLHHDDEYAGTGIGLALCQEIVEHHGGDVRVDSEPGVGSTFTVTLPKRAGE